jgi:plastocyanin
MIVLLIATAGCGGANEEPRGASRASQTPSSPDVTPTGPSCPPPSVSLEITAKDLEFDKECLVVPAHEPFTIRFTNSADGVPHNFAIHSATLAETFLEGKVIKGVKTITVKANALDPGEYIFQCDLHPLRMNGTLVPSG